MQAGSIQDSTQNLMAGAWQGVLPRKSGLHSKTGERIHFSCRPHLVFQKDGTLPLLHSRKGLRELSRIAHENQGRTLWGGEHRELFEELPGYMSYNYAVLLHTLNTSVRASEIENDNLPPFTKAVDLKTWKFWKPEEVADLKSKQLTRILTVRHLKNAVSEWDNYFKDILAKGYGYFWLAEHAIRAVYANIDSIGKIQHDNLRQAVEDLHSFVASDKSDGFNRKLLTESEIRDVDYRNNLREPVKELYLLAVISVLSAIGDEQAYDLSKEKARDGGPSPYVSASPPVLPLVEAVSG